MIIPNSFVDKMIRSSANLLKWIIIMEAVERNSTEEEEEGGSREGRKKKEKGFIFTVKLHTD